MEIVEKLLSIAAIVLLLGIYFTLMRKGMLPGG